MSEEEEIKFLKKKLLLRWQKEYLMRQLESRRREEIINPEEYVRSHLTPKAIEVLEAAKSQYPNIMPKVIKAIAEVIARGEVETPIDAITLLNTLRLIGLDVRLESKIKFYKKGKYMDIRQYLKEKE